MHEASSDYGVLSIITLPRLIGTADRVPAGLAAGWGSNTDFTSSRIGSGAWEKKLDFLLFISCTELVLRWKTQSSLFGVTRVQSLHFIIIKSLLLHEATSNQKVEFFITYMELSKMPIFMVLILWGMIQYIPDTVLEDFWYHQVNFKYLLWGYCLPRINRQTYFPW